MSLPLPPRENCEPYPVVQDFPARMQYSKCVGHSSAHQFSFNKQKTHTLYIPSWYLGFKAYVEPVNFCKVVYTGNID